MSKTGNSIPGIRKLREAIPPHCFQPKPVVTSLYIIQSFAGILLVGATMLYVPYITELKLVRFASWAFGGFVQGLILTGVWILAHECGHGALFNSELTNDIVGFALHTLLLVPYFPWKFTHARHHRYTNHMTKDTAFVPQRTNQSSRNSGSDRVNDNENPFLHSLQESPFYQLALLTGHQLFGWPSYLFFYYTGGHQSTQRPIKPSKSQSHFNPWSILFDPGQKNHVLISDLGLFCMFLALYWAAVRFGVTTILLVYGIPYLWVNHWIVAVTFLHHSHLSVPHFDNDSWTFTKGALATVDRDFGFIGRHLFHGIIEYHVIHHLFPRIPFYHAEEATRAIIPVLGDSYILDTQPFLAALWTTFRGCKSVIEDEHNSGVFRFYPAIEIPIK